MHRVCKYGLMSVLSLFLGMFLLSSFAKAAETLKIVENDKVCMVTDMHFPKKQIPVTFDGKTYYGCCANCKETLAKDAKARTAVDPVTGKAVDKAKAVIAVREDHSVLYFESEKTFKQYSKQAAAPGAVGQSHHHDHSGH